MQTYVYPVAVTSNPYIPNSKSDPNPKIPFRQWELQKFLDTLRIKVLTKSNDLT